MANDKKSFLIYCDLIHTIRKMKKEDAGELFLHLLEYTNDLNPTTTNPFVELVFEPIKHQLKRDLISWEKEKNDKSLNGRLGNLKRWNNDLFLKLELEEITLEEAESIAKHRKASQSDINNQGATKPVAEVAVTDTVIVTVNDKDIYKSFLHLSLSKKEFLEINKEYSKGQIDFALLGIENTKNVSQYKSLDYAVRYWLKDRPKENVKSKKPPLL